VLTSAANSKLEVRSQAVAIQSARRRLFARVVISSHLRLPINSGLWVQMWVETPPNGKTSMNQTDTQLDGGADGARTRKVCAP